MKIFKIEEGDPLLWQLSYVDSEISKIIQNRFSARNSSADYGFIEREERANAQKEEKKATRQEVTRMELTSDESCCVCFENLKEEDNLTYCKYGCGRNLHTDCIEVWVKHKVSVG